GGGAVTQVFGVRRRATHFREARDATIVDRGEVKVAGNENDVLDLIRLNVSLKGFPLRLITGPAVRKLRCRIRDDGRKDNLPERGRVQETILKPFQLTA